MNSGTQTISGNVYEELRHDIISCRILPGSKINIQALVQRFQVSLGAVREALSKLSAEGLVEAMAQRGYSVANVSAEDLAELTDARVRIEQDCLRLAIEVGGLEWEAEIVAALHRLLRTPFTARDDKRLLDGQWVIAHGDFHRSLVAGCGNRWLLRVRGQLYDQSERYRQLSVPLDTTDRDLDSEHRYLAEAVLARDAQSACSAISDHMWKTTEIVTGALLKVSMLVK